jgi:hypothetical protein
MRFVPVPVPFKCIENSNNKKTSDAPDTVFAGYPAGWISS